MGVVMEPFGSTHRPMGTNQVQRWMKRRFSFIGRMLFCQESTSIICQLFLSPATRRGIDQDPHPAARKKRRFANKAPWPETFSAKTP
jgi:hypothetical protein